MSFSYVVRCKRCGHFQYASHVCPDWALNNLAKYEGYTEPRKEKGRKKAHEEPIIKCNGCRKDLRRCDVNQHFKRKPQCLNGDSHKVCICVC